MRILLVEDNRDILANLADYLDMKGYSVDCAQDGLSGLHLAATEHYDLIVLDIMLPGIDGYTLCKRLREDARRDTPVIMLTARDQLDDKLEGFQAGADDYLVKPFAFAELLARVRTLLRRGASVIVESQFQVADLTLDLVSRKVTRGDSRITLTSKEFTLLEFFLRHQGEVLPRSLIASQVWDMNFDSDTNAIDVAIKRLRAKIDNDFSPKLIQTVRGVGYVLEVRDEG